MIRPVELRYYSGELQQVGTARGVTEGRRIALVPLEPSVRVLADSIRTLESPALILELPTETIVASSGSADRMFGFAGTSAVGSLFGDFTEGPSRESMELVTTGLISGYATGRVLIRTGERVRFWIHGLDGPPPVHLVLALVLRPKGPAGSPSREPDSARSLPVIGSTDAAFLIDGISVGDDQEVLGYPPRDLVGRPLLSIIDPVDTARVMVVVERMAAAPTAVAVHTQVICRDRSTISGQLLLLPRGRQGGHTFAVIDAETGTPSGAAAVVGVLQRLGDDISYASREDSAADRPQRVGPAALLELAPGLARLSPRELEIVTMLMAGDRVPTIAGRLFLSRSTIRNHLSAAFGKLGVRSQQELIDLLRPH